MDGPRKKLYLDSVREGLEELASEGLQRRRWLATGGPEIGSFDEAIAQTYDDSGLSDITDDTSQAASAGLSEDALRILRTLLDATRSVDRSLAVEALIESEAMNNVRYGRRAWLREAKEELERAPRTPRRWRAVAPSASRPAGGG